jgi:hypothetical protein
VNKQWACTAAMGGELPLRPVEQTVLIDEGQITG